MADESLLRILGGLVWELFKLIAPIAALTLLPPFVALGMAVLMALATWISARLGWPRQALVCDWLLTASVMGLSFSVFKHWPWGWGWGIAAVAALLIIGLSLASALRKRLGLAPVRAEALEDTTEGGGSAWNWNPNSTWIAGSDGPRTPEGEAVRIFNWGEIAMGGPAYADYLFPDGVLLEGLGSSTRFSDNGRYFAAPLPSRERWGLLILDRHERRVYRNNAVGELWEIDEFTDDAIIGRYSPLVENKSYRVELAGLLAQSEAVDLVAVRDLWLEPREWPADTVTIREFPAPAGAHCLRGRPYLPERLRELEDPLAPLRYPILNLQVDDEPPSGLLLAAEDQPVWRADGQALVCRSGDARRARPLHVWQAGQGWRRLADPRIEAENEPSLNWREIIGLDETALRRAGEMGMRTLDHLRFGYQFDSYSFGGERCVGHDSEGRILSGERQCPRLIRLQPLAGEGRRGESAILGETLSGGAPPRFEWRRDSDDGGLGAYACSIGAWQIEGEWLLEHRVSDCGRYLALVAFADAPAAPHRLCVVDAQERRLLYFAQRPIIAALLDFRGGVLSVAQTLGRLVRGDADTPLRRFEQAAPPAERAASFLKYQEHSRLYYRQLDVRVADGALEALPGWRVADRPQVANADGDFVLPAPHGRDAAWLFGAESKYRDGYPNARHPRGGGCLLTASGLAVSDLGPAMIWSEDGRYLALTRHVEQLRAIHQTGQRVDTDQWQLLLLDTQARTLRPIHGHLGCMPQFLRFDANGIEWRILPGDWEDEDAANSWQARRIGLETLTRYAAVTLQRRGERWLPPEELARASQWQRVDAGHLQPWRHF